MNTLKKSSLERKSINFRVIDFRKKSEAQHLLNMRRFVFFWRIGTYLSWKKLANVSLCTTSTGWSTHSSQNASLVVSTLATAPVVQSAFHPGMYLGCHRWSLSSQLAFTKPIGNLWREKNTSNGFRSVNFRSLKSRVISSLRLSRAGQRRSLFYQSI